MSFFKRALGGLLSLLIALLAPVLALAQTERAPILPAAPATLLAPPSPPALPQFAQAAALPALAAPRAASPVAAAPSGQAPAAAAALRAAGAAAKPSAVNARGAQDAARLDAFWSGRRGAAAIAVAAPVALSRAQGYATAGVVLAGTYGLHRAVRFGIDWWATRHRWDPNKRDTAHFIGLLGTWTLGAAVGLHLAHVATAKLVATIGLALTFAVKDSVSNILQAVLFLVRRPFLLGEKIRIGDTLFVVENMQAQYVTLRRVAQLVSDKPGDAPAGFVVLPMEQVDPLKRSVDDKGRKWAILRSPLRPDGPPRGEYVRYNYTLLASKPFSLFRPYVDKRASPRFPELAQELRPLRWRAPLLSIAQAVKATPRKTLLATGLWLGLAVASVPLWPLLRAHATLWGVQALWPWLHGLLTLWASRQVWKFFDAFLPILSGKLGWRQQALVVVRLAVQAGLFLGGGGAALSAMRFDWQSMVTSLGVTAAAAAWASGDILTNLSTGFMLRWTRPFNVGEYLGVGTDYSGLVQEMNPFHVVLKPAEGMHTLVPYSAISGNELHTLERDPGASK